MEKLFKAVQEVWGLPYPEPKSPVEIMANYQHIINSCNYNIQQILLKTSKNADNT
jgi:hypothetical protein